MLTVHLARGGKKDCPFYYIVVAESGSRRDGRFVERLGFYNPLARKMQEEFRLNEERLAYWLSVGAKLSDAVASVVRKARKAKRPSSNPVTE
jgi:small subunit ribosomal protein S16